jgi:hypothetical protein
MARNRGRPLAKDRLGKLRQPILAIRDGVVELLAQLRAVIGPIVSAMFVVLIALAARIRSSFRSCEDGPTGRPENLC